MKKKFLIYSFISSMVMCFSLAACSDGVTSRRSITVTAPALNTAMIIITPNITATPIPMTADNERDIEKFVEEIYRITPECKLDILKPNETKYERPILKFEKSDVDPVLMNYSIFEIADNSSQTLRAYVACDTLKCQPGIYIKDQKNGAVTVIQWSGQAPYRPIARMIWIGDDFLAFVHQPGPAMAVVTALQFSERKFLLYWWIDDHCQ